MSKLIERQMALQKVRKFSRVLKVIFMRMHVQWNVSCTLRVYYNLQKVLLSPLQIVLNQIPINDRLIDPQ